MDQRQEGEYSRDDDGKPCSHEDIDHQVAHGLAAHDAVDTPITLMDRHQILEAVALTSRSCSQTDTQDQRLLENQHEYGGDDEVAIAPGRIEDGHIFEVKRPRRDHILTVGIVARHFLLNLSSHCLGHDDRGLVNGFIGEHQRHIAVNTDHALFHAVDMGGEIRRYEIDALRFLTADDRLRLFEIAGIGNNLHIG